MGLWAFCCTSLCPIPSAIIWQWVRGGSARKRRPIAAQGVPQANTPFLLLSSLTPETSYVRQHPDWQEPCPFLGSEPQMDIQRKNVGRKKAIRWTITGIVLIAAVGGISYALTKLKP